jgi:hypothetical protein
VQTEDAHAPIKPEWARAVKKESHFSKAWVAGEKRRLRKSRRVIVFFSGSRPGKRPASFALSSVERGELCSTIAEQGPEKFKIDSPVPRFDLIDITTPTPPAQAGNRPRARSGGEF